MLGLPQNHWEGWRKEIEAKLLGKMPQTTLHAWPNQQTMSLPEFAVTTTTTAVSLSCGFSTGSSALELPPQIVALATGHINRNEAQLHMVPLASRACVTPLTPWL